MGEVTDGGLYEIFQQDFGPVGSPSFENARKMFIISSAGYAVASLLLQPKDRHNGNLLFDKYVILYIFANFMPLAYAKQLIPHRLQLRKVGSYWFWVHIGDITWWKHAFWKCSFQIESWNDPVTWSFRFDEKWYMVTICKVSLVKFSSLSHTSEF